MRPALALAATLALLSAFLARPVLADLRDPADVALESEAEVPDDTPPPGAIAALPTTPIIGSAAVAAPAIVPAIDPLALQALGALVVVLVVYAAGRWGGALRRIPRVYLPLVAAVLGALVQLGAQHLGWGDGDVSTVRTALEGAMGAGASSAWLWSASGPVRKRSTPDDDLPAPLTPAPV